MKFLQSPKMSVCDTEGFERITGLVGQGWNVPLEELSPGWFLGSEFPARHHHHPVRSLHAGYLCVMQPLKSCSRIPALIPCNQDGGSALGTFLGGSGSPKFRALLSGGLPGTAPPRQAGLSLTHSLCPALGELSLLPAPLQGNSTGLSKGRLPLGPSFPLEPLSVGSPLPGELHEQPGSERGTVLPGGKRASL